MVERGLGNYAAAAPDLKAAVAMKPTDFEALYNLGYVLAHLNKPAEARPPLEKALKIDPNSSKVQFQLAAVLRALGLHQEARQALDKFESEKAQEREQMWLRPGESGQSKSGDWRCPPGD